MKILTLSNGEIRNGYEIMELSAQAKEYVLMKEVYFEVYLAHLKDDYSGTTTNKKSILKDLISKKYLYDEQGKNHPLYHTVNKNNETSLTFGLLKHTVIITDSNHLN